MFWLGEQIQSSGQPGWAVKPPASPPPLNNAVITYCNNLPSDHESPRLINYILIQCEHMIIKLLINDYGQMKIRNGF